MTLNEVESHSQRKESRREVKRKDDAWSKQDYDFRLRFQRWSLSDDQVPDVTLILTWT